MQKAGVSERQITAGGLITALLFLASMQFTGAPYMAVGVIVIVPIVGWACIKPKRLVYLLIVYCCLYPYLVSDMGLPRLLHYGADLINILALFFALRGRKLRSISWGWLPLPIVVFSCLALFTAMLHEVNPLLVVWEIRNVFRFFVFMVACAGLLDAEDVSKIFKFLMTVFFINLLLCSFESLVLGYGQDNTNGLFGSGSGGNAATNILLLEMTCVALFGYGRKAVNFSSLLAVVIASCWVSIISELKFYFVQLAALIVIYVLISKPSLKNLLIVVVLFAGLYAAIQAFYTLMPDWKNYFDLENLIESSSEGGYGSSEGLNRLSAIGTLQSMFLNDTTSALIGLGFGAGTYSQFFSSPLYTAWGEILHWTWFTDAQIFLETGYVGLICYGNFFIVLAVRSLRLRRSFSGENAAFIEASGTLALFCIPLMFYNCVLTVDPGGYLIFFMLAVPLVLERDAIRETVESQVA